MTLPTEMREKSASYQELFGADKIDALGIMEVFTASDAQGDIQVTCDEKQISDISRKINGKWYSHIPKADGDAHPPSPPFAGLDRLTLWISHDKPKHFLYIEPETMKPVFRINKDGTLNLYRKELLDGNIAWEWVHPQVLQGNGKILSVDPRAFILRAKTSGNPPQMLLHLPSLTDEGGKTVVFRSQQVMGQAQPRWVLESKPTLFISGEQKMPGIRNYSEFLVLETISRDSSAARKKNDREVFLPIRPKRDLTSVVASPVAEKPEIVSCVSIKIKNDNLDPKDPKSTCYLAYLSLIQASTPKEMRKTKLFQGLRKFKRFEPEELQLLGWIFKAEDGTVYADAIRLLAAGLVHENFTMYPQVKKENKSRGKGWTKQPAVHWEMFWEDSLPEDKLPVQICQMTNHYFERVHHLPLDMRIDKILPPQVLAVWNLKRYANEGKLRLPEATAVARELVDADVKALMRECKRTRGIPKIPNRTRPSNAMNENFFALLDAALSGDPAMRKIAERQLRDMQQDPKSKIYEVLLNAALQSSTTIMPKRSLMF